MFADILCTRPLRRRLPVSRPGFDTFGRCLFVQPPSLSRYGTADHVRASLSRPAPTLTPASQAVCGWLEGDVLLHVMSAMVGGPKKANKRNKMNPFMTVVQERRASRPPKIGGRLMCMPSCCNTTAIQRPPSTPSVASSVLLPLHLYSFVRPSSAVRLSGPLSVCGLAAIYGAYSSMVASLISAGITYLLFSLTMNARHCFNITKTLAV